MVGQLSKNNKGFSLIEILVVIAIIGILTSILVVNYNEARENSRDKIRKSDLKSLQLAIELYKSQNGQYPAMGCGTPGTHWAGSGPHSASWGASCDVYIAGLVPDYIGKLPADPSRESEDNTGYIYTTDAGRTSYKLLAHQSVESNFITSFADEFARCPSLGGSCTNLTDPWVRATYAIYSVGAEQW